MTRVARTALALLALGLLGSTADAGQRRSHHDNRGHHAWGYRVNGHNAHYGPHGYRVHHVPHYRHGAWHANGSGNGYAAPGLVGKPYAGAAGYGAPLAAVQPPKTPPATALASVVAAQAAPALAAPPQAGGMAQVTPPPSAEAPAPDTPEVMPNEGEMERPK